MKLKSVVLIFIVLVIGVSFIAYSTNAQKSKGNKETKSEAKSDENLMREIGRNAVCTMLYENMRAKETDGWTIKHADCADSSSYANLSLQNGKKEMIIFVKDCKTPEQAKITLTIAFGQEGFKPNKEFGDRGHKDSSNISFIKGRIFVNIYHENFDSDETPKRFAKYALKAIEGQ